MITRHIAKKYVGMKYDRDNFNCFHLLKAIYADLGFTVLDVNVGKLDPNWSYKGKNYFLENCATQWKEVQMPRSFDVVLLQNFHGIAHHAGVMLDDVRFIHASTNGVEIRRISEKSINKKLFGFYRFKGAANG